jgi:outer membrane immunogenic protein
MKQVIIAVVAAVISALGLSQVASAADMPMKAPPMVAPIAPPPPTWTGFYIGAHGGGLWTRADGSWDPGPTPATFGVNPISGDFNDTAFAVGGQLGYNWQFAPTWVAGIEGDWTWTNASGGFTGAWIDFATGLPRPAGQFTTMSMDLNWLASVRGRIGYLVVPEALVYFTGGVAWGNIDYSAQAVALSGANYNAQSSFSDTSVGYVLGGGVEWLISGHWMLRGEYLFYHLNSGTSTVAFDSTGNFPPPTFPSGFNWGDLEVSVARAALSYKF